MSLIYCHGPLLHTIQMAKIYEDSKTFVDMKLKRPANETLEIFEQFMIKHNNTPTNNDVKQFLSHNFEPAGQEFEDWVPNDWVEYPKYLDKIQDPLLREWGVSLNLIWKELGRKMKEEVKQNQDLYSIVWVPHPVIVPGGRFREFYYWDSYWIVQGLLLSEMYETVRGKLENFLYIVDTYGHIPNGGRIYYMERSQPPLMIPMIKNYFDFTNDIKFIADNMRIMEKELDYWLTKHTKTILHDGKNYTLAVYGDFSKGPRPESYSEDIDSAAIFKDQDMKEFHYSELKAGAESGWDFSSRWFITNATNKGNLTNLNTRSIVPVDLNAMIYWNAVLLAEFHEILGNKDKASNYTDIAEEWLEAVTAVLWHEEVGSWLDYDLINSIKRDYFYPTNISPLWTGCYKKEEKEKIVRLVLKYLQTVNVMYPGGIPTTKEHTGEQWDFPNAWPPLQHIMIVGLNSTGDEAAQRLAFEIAEKWTRSNYKSFNETATMYEKYDATVSGGHGGGGEYEVQFGFGWTNGVIMDLLDRYGDVFRVEDAPPEEYQAIVQGAAINAPSTYGQVATALLALIVSLTAGYIG
ncbi:trehalase isoform X2 [Agrilus planipennis]|uniref:Trehalase n=1 Tax=Agrilus planipennis TaxID=224129 RepID=A0A1W4WFC2_AGRPL|nr:trehalase isoform X2 [Agrilus planipennis]